jgi:hypothetical protein
VSNYEHINIALSKENERQMRAFRYWRDCLEKSMRKQPGLFVLWAEKMMELEQTPKTTFGLGR